MDGQLILYPNKECEECGAKGAFDIDGDIVCPECLAPGVPFIFTNRPPVTN